MVLESTFICVDNSEFTRNGDFLPTRLQAQQEAVSVITQSKLRSNPESNVGLLTLSCLDVLVTLTTDSGKILAKLHAVQPKGELKLLSGIRIAHLALKHRLGKKHKTRIIAFIGSPISGDEKDLVKLAKKLKKEKVSVDIVNFGEVEANESLLKKFIETVNGKDGSGSHLVSIPLGPHLSDALLSSPIVQGEDGSGVVAGPGGFEFGVDPNEDPELALALRVSMEEQRARQEQQAPSNSSRQAGEDSSRPEDASTTKGPAAAQDDEVLLEKALKMSMDTDEPNLSAMTEDEQIAYAMKMSMQGGEEESSTPKEEKMDVDEQAAGSSKTRQGDDDYSEAMNDPAFLQNVLENLPGVDPQSDAIKQAMGAMTGAKKKSNDKSDKETKDGKK